MAIISFKCNNSSVGVIYNWNCTFNNNNNNSGGGSNNGPVAGAEGAEAMRKVAVVAVTVAAALGYEGGI